MDNTIVWIIIAGFYAPLHYIPPILLVLFKTAPENRNFCIKRSVIDSSFSMLVAFGLVFYLGAEQILQAMVILLLALLFPYIRVAKVLLKNRSTGESVS